MADTAHKNPEDLEEHFESMEALEEKAAILADWIRLSKHFIAFTGAGISTSCGIPDYRGPEGVWTLRAQGKTAKANTTTLKAIPSTTHMSLLRLQTDGLLKYIVSQNTDGLHRRSGINPLALSELHGNSNLEKCESCPAEFLRDRRVRINATGVNDHYTGNTCPKCKKGRLQDTIINFGENLPEETLLRAVDNADEADLCLSLGSSLTVSPANSIPKRVAKRGKHLVIVNLQNTPLDSYADLRVYAKTDDFMKIVMRLLDLEIPKFILSRRAVVDFKEASRELTIRGVDHDGIPASIFSKVEVKIGSSVEILKEEPYQLNLEESTDKIQVTLHFMGNYSEPPVIKDFDILGDKSALLMMDYDPYTRTWTITE